MFSRMRAQRFSKEVKTGCSWSSNHQGRRGWAQIAGVSIWVVGQQYGFGVFRATQSQTFQDLTSLGLESSRKLPQRISWWNSPHERGHLLLQAPHAAFLQLMSCETWAWLFPSSPEFLVTRQFLPEQHPHQNPCWAPVPSFPPVFLLLLSWEHLLSFSIHRTAKHQPREEPGWWLVWGFSARAGSYWKGPFVYTRE